MTGGSLRRGGRGGIYNRRRSPWSVAGLSSGRWFVIPLCNGRLRSPVAERNDEPPGGLFMARIMLDILIATTSLGR